MNLSHLFIAYIPDQAPLYVAASTFEEAVRKISQYAQSKWGDVSILRVEAAQGFLLTE